MGLRRLFPESSPRSLSVVDIMMSYREVRLTNLLASIALSALLLCFFPQKAWSAECNLSPEIRSELAKASNLTALPSDFDSNVAPLLALRQRHPDDLLVHELYQDAVQRYGIEGHLRKLTEDYQILSMQHPDDLTYDYLYARSLMGRNTPAAIREITKLLEGHPNFAPGHRTLAEIYSAAAFRNDDKEKTEREHFLALCPGAILQQRPGPLPEPSPLVDQAERFWNKTVIQATSLPWPKKASATTSGAFSAYARSTGTALNTSAKASAISRKNTGRCGASTSAVIAGLDTRKEQPKFWPQWASAPSH